LSSTRLKFLQRVTVKVMRNF